MNVVALIIEVTAEQAMIASPQLIRKRTVVAVITLLQCHTVIDGTEIDALIAQRAFASDVQTGVHGRLVIHHPVAVVHVFTRHDE